MFEHKKVTKPSWSPRRVQVSECSVHSETGSVLADQSVTGGYRCRIVKHGKGVCGERSMHCRVHGDVDFMKTVCSVMMGTRRNETQIVKIRRSREEKACDIGSIKCYGDLQSGSKRRTESQRRNTYIAHAHD